RDRCGNTAPRNEPRDPADSEGEREGSETLSAEPPDQEQRGRGGEDRRRRLDEKREHGVSRDALRRVELTPLHHLGRPVEHAGAPSWVFLEQRDTVGSRAGQLRG